MNQEENTNSVVFNGHQETHSSGNENAEVRNHYFHQHSLMNPDTGAVVSDDAWLFSLKRRTMRFVEMLSLLEHSSVEEIPLLQKACFSYFLEDTVPRKERQRIIEAWSGWTDFLFSLNRYRDLASLFLRYHQHVLQEIESLLPPSAAEVLPSSQTANQEGGI